MAQVTVKELAGRDTDWYPTFKVTTVLSKEEVANLCSDAAYILRDGKILKNGTCKMSRTRVFMGDTNTPEAIFESDAKLLNWLGLSVDGYTGEVFTGDRTPKARRPVTLLD